MTSNTTRKTRTAKTAAPFTPAVESKGKGRPASTRPGRRTGDPRKDRALASEQAKKEQVTVLQVPEPKKETAAKSTAKKAPAKSTAKKAPAKKAPVKKAPAKKAPAQDDVITKHIAQVFAEVPSGTFIKARDITNAVTKQFPKEDTRPSVHTIFTRCRSNRLPDGVTGQVKPCGATKE